MDAFGFFPDEAEDRSVLSGIRKSLKENGCLLIYNVNGGKIARNFREFDQESKDGVSFSIHRKYDRSACLMEEKIEVFDCNGTNETCVRRQRLYTADMLVEALTGEGYSNIKLFSDFSRERFLDHESSQIILVAKRASTYEPL